MSAFVAALTALVELAKEAPELASAVEGVFNALTSKQDPTPAMKHAQAVAEALELGLDPKQV